MPIDDLTALGQKMREARKKKDLTQQELADLSHVSVKQIASIEKGQINPSYLILKALAKVLPISLDTLINPDVSPEDDGANRVGVVGFYDAEPDGGHEGQQGDDLTRSAFSPAGELVPDIIDSGGICTGVSQGEDEGHDNRQQYGVFEHGGVLSWYLRQSD